jgi:CheY-like chemotaxis protein
VEDEALIAEALRARLSDLGVSVIAAVDSGEEGIEIATREQPDLVLMDIRLKGGKDGVASRRGYPPGSGCRYRVSDRPF